MERNDPADVRAAADTIPARDALAPALRLWLVLGITWGVVGFLLHVVPEAFPHFALVMLAHVVMTVAVVRQARHDRGACRVFAHAPRLAVAFVLPIAIVGSLGLWLVERDLLLVDRPPPLEQGRGVAHAIGVMTVGLWPGVVEEVAFRGVILQRLRTVCGASFAVAVQAMMFALLRDSDLVLPQFAFGCLAGALRLAGRALWPGVLMHVVGNAALVLDGYGSS